MLLKGLRCRYPAIRFNRTFTTKDEILPDHLVYNIPKYEKNPDNFDFPWLVGGAPSLEIKVVLIKLGSFSSRTSIH
jgi:hypothetical protein